LNMVRAGVVATPQQWRWCAIADMLQRRRRRDIVDSKLLCTLTGSANPAEHLQQRVAAIEAAIRGGQLHRVPDWTEAVAVGRKSFVEATKRSLRYRSPGRRVGTSTTPSTGETECVRYVLREPKRTSYCASMSGFAPSGQGQGNMYPWETGAE
jgi:hypothetical protein